MLNKKLIYIFNHYSHDSSSHFFHILHLLDTIANNGVMISLVIEKMEDVPPINNPNIQLTGLKRKSKIGRNIELLRLLKKLNKKGFKKIFIRITAVTASIAIIFSIFFRSQIYYWHSGQVFEYDFKQNFGLKKIKWFFKSYLPFWFTKTYVDFFVTGPESMGDYYKKIVGVKKEKIVILYNDIDIKRFKKSTPAEKIALKKKYKLPPEKKIILFVHRLSPVRQTHLYIPYIFDILFEEEKDFVVYIIGDGPEKKPIQKVINNKAYANNIKFFGNIPNSEIHDYYKLADVFINPTFVEGFPRVLIEAMASGLAVVTTDAGGIKDILGTKQLELMVPKNNVTQFAKTLIKILSDSGLTKELENENLLSVQKFSTENVANMYIKEIFESNE